MCGVTVHERTDHCSSGRDVAELHAQTLLLFTYYGSLEIEKADQTRLSGANQQQSSP